MTLRDLLEAHPDGLSINELMIKSRLPHRQIKSELDKLPVVFDGEFYMLYQNPEQKALLQAKISQNRDKEADKGTTPKKPKHNPPFTPNPIMGYQVQKETRMNDHVNHPPYYTQDPSGIECIQITRHRNFNIGNAMKYLWRAGLKCGNSDIQDLQKAVWYINDEIERLEAIQSEYE